MVATDFVCCSDIKDYSTSPLNAEAMAATLKGIVTPRAVATTIRITLPAGKAAPGPPVIGAALGPYGLNQLAFCKEFNARTQKYKPNTPLAVKVTAFKDRCFEFQLKSPSVTWFIKQAAGVDFGSSRPGHVVASTITIKHVYEIAKVKQSDGSFCEYMPLESICKSIMGTAKSMGIQVEKDLD
ncbi:54S ribosomal protein L19, mitochondrial [Heracleum sosnowskyi]|uniref:Large ribosomal subunit protein uL11m n=1 Tax=Heracleum sosnowskyi TaxID=360622 RepID=A0AAD8I6N7_9APIA|nr:54S ribosomal protein L19, mitochondrial [Heracleum sosnowskyi]